MKPRTTFCAILVGLAFASFGRAQAPFVFAESGPFELYTAPQSTVPRLTATVVGIRAKDPAHTIEQVRALAIYGDVQQTWALNVRSGDDLRATVFRQDMTEWLADPLYIPDWGIGDTHLIPKCRDGDYCAIVGTVEEDNDVSDPLNFGLDFFGTLDGDFDDYITISGVGDLAMPAPGDALDFTSAAARSVDLAYVVTHAAAPGRPHGNVWIALEVLGRDAAGQPLALRGQFGLEPGHPLAVAFVPEPSSFSLAGMAAIFFLQRFCLPRRRVNNTGLASQT